MGIFFFHESTGLLFIKKAVLERVTIEMKLHVTEQFICIYIIYILYTPKKFLFFLSLIQ